MKLDLCFALCTKTKFRWIIDLNAKDKTVKLLEDGIFHGLKIGNGFFFPPEIYFTEVY